MIRTLRSLRAALMRARRATRVAYRARSMVAIARAISSDSIVAAAGGILLRTHRSGERRTRVMIRRRGTVVAFATEHGGTGAVL